MILYVVRHARAAPLGDAVPRDAERPLTEEGVADAALIGSALARLDPSVSLVLCSPLLRARQTAEALARQFPAPPAVRETDGLSPGFRPAALVKELQAVASGESIAAVGHQPDLGRFIAHVIEGEPSASIDLPPAALACIRFAGDAASEAGLRWLLTPDAIGKLFSPR